MSEFHSYVKKGISFHSILQYKQLFVNDVNVQFNSDWIELNSFELNSEATSQEQYHLRGQFQNVLQ